MTLPNLPIIEAINWVSNRLKLYDATIYDLGSQRGGECPVFLIRDDPGQW